MLSDKNILCYQLHNVHNQFITSSYQLISLLSGDNTMFSDDNTMLLTKQTMLSADKNFVIG
jgi:hypothetical protein